MRLGLIILALAPPTATAADTLAAEMVQAHNTIRTARGIPPLRWSSELAAYAAIWAEALAKRNAFEHRPSNPYGENLYLIAGGAATATQVVQSWAAEARDYNERDNTCRKVCGHYTQLVWRATTMVGCATSHSGKRQIWVCNYNPPGLMQKQAARPMLKEG